jgi:hypothetical protein
VSGVFVVIVLVVVLAAAGLAYLSWYAAKKRREAFAMWAARKGWSYTERDDRWVDSFSGPPFGQGHNKKAQNVVTGTAYERPFVAFDYVYYTTETTSTGKTTSTRQVAHPYGIAAVDTGEAMPALDVSPEGMFGRLIGRLTGTDIELESEDFNRMFTVQCPDRKFASDVLHPMMMQFLMQHPGTSFRFDGRYAVSAEEGQVAIESIESRLAFLDEVLDRVPEFVWQNLKGEV